MAGVARTGRSRAVSSLQILASWSPFDGYGRSEWLAGGLSSSLTPSPVTVVVGGGRSPVSKKSKGFREVRERGDREERESPKKFKSFSLSRFLSKSQNYSIDNIPV